MKLQKNLIVFFAAVLLSGCGSIFLPRKQTVTIITENDDAKVLVNHTVFGEGSEIKNRIRKDGPLQVVVQVPGYKDTYATLLPKHRPAMFWPLQVLNLCAAVYAWNAIYYDRSNENTSKYDKVTTIPIPEEYRIDNRDSTEKFIHISNIKITLTEADFKYIGVKYSKSPEKLQANIVAAKKKVEENYQKKVEKTAKANKKKKKTLEPVKDEVFEYNYKKYTENIYQTLKTTGFIDTVNKIFTDHNNTLVLDANITKTSIYAIYSKRWSKYVYTAELDLTWYIKNTYGEIMDSVQTSETSGEFVTERYVAWEKLYADAIDISYIKLRKSPVFLAYSKQGTQFRIKDSLMVLQIPLNPIKEKSDAVEAAVIVKTEKGHGSGFAISNDGYIVTNYHVIAGKNSGHPQAVTVITSTGEEFKANVVRYNVHRDLAVLKIDRSFEKAFVLSDAKTFRTLDNIYTIGAPKSIELGQSMTSGVISNERKTNNNHLIQLGMSVNSGNSGGPVFDDTGKLQGVLVAKLIGENTEGICFAIPGFLVLDYLNIQYK